MSKKKNAIKPPKTAQDLLDMYYLEARSYLVETAAVFDRIERADTRDKIMADQRIDDLFALCRILTGTRKNRVEKMLTFLSE